MTPGKIIFKGKTKNGKDLLIRYLSSDDVEGLRNFINKISLEKTLIIYQGEQFTFDQEKEYIDSKIKLINQNKSVYLLAFVNNELIGSSDIEINERVRSHQGVFGIAIAKKYRGEGIGKLLMKIVIKESKKNFKKLIIITLDVFANNLAAQKLYESFGFLEYGRLSKGFKYKNGYIDQVLMYKKID